MADKKPNFKTEPSDKKWEKLAEEVEFDINEDNKAMDHEHEEVPAITHPKYEEVLAQLSQAETEVNEAKDKAARCLAELENERRRSERALTQAHQYGVERFAKEILQVMDNLERALQHKPEDISSLHEGVELTLKLFQKALEKFSITPIDPINTMFDPTLHEAMSTQIVEDKKPGTVLMVLQKGYLLHDRLLRPAMVIVAKSPENSSSSR
jgi:molecular chaperone GrpE